jgi:hypothetical protein
MSNAIDRTGIGVPRTFSGTAADCAPPLREAKASSADCIQQMSIDQEHVQADQEAGRIDFSNPAPASDGSHPPGLARPLPLAPAMRRWEREAMRSMNDSRTIVRASREGSTESLSCQMLGAHDLYGMMLSAPCSDKGALAAVRENESLMFSTIYGTAAVKFIGTIRKVQFQPTPLIYVTPSRVHMREVRAKPRVNTCIHAAIAMGDRELPALINDIGVGGLSMATQKSDHEFATGEQCNARFCLSVLDKIHVLRVQATVMTIRNELTRDHPEISAAGVQVEVGSDLERLVIHAFVQERLAQDLGTVWRVLFAAR